MKSQLGSVLLLCAVALPFACAPSARAGEDVDRAVNQMYKALVRIMVVMESPRSSGRNDGS